ncbi:MAG: glycogen/starch synthase [Ilumatobacteraceae bacterium]
MRVVFATAELTGVAAVGGLADAAAGLTRELRRQGADVDVVMPDYTPERRRVALGGEVRRRIDVPGWAAPATVRAGEHPIAGRVHLVSVPGMARSHPYLRPDGLGWPDNPARFLAFSRAVAAMVRRNPPDILHLNDWHTGAVLAALPAPPPSVLTLHSVAYQGVTDASWLRRLGSRGAHYEWWGGTNPLSGAIALADAILAVSPPYAREILTPAGGFGLDGPLRDRGAAVSGIRNGIDTTRWDPATDRHLAATFSVDEPRRIAAARAVNRRALLERCGWPDDGVPLAVVVSRLTGQKGIDMLQPIVPVLAHIPMRLMVLGAGEAALAQSLAGLTADHRDRFAFVERYDEPLARLMFGGGDVFVMPSRFEPCGLAQMQAMRYGAIPVVTAVGGLRDTVPDVDAQPGGNGFVADAVEPVAVVSALFRAARLLADRRRHPALVRHVMAQDWSWRQPAAEHLARYGEISAVRTPTCGGVSTPSS